ncbi:MAG: 2'-5' RNA ligase family protein [Actinobacteria bacterium]|nr:2'-5' RNA ligase family protein [Actinomycetota bacterium]
MAGQLSLWAVPSREDAVTYVDTICRLASDSGTKPFAPHITVTSADHGGGTGAAARDVIGRVASEFESFTVELTHFEDSDQRFRCLTAVARLHGPLVRLHAGLVAALSAEPKGYEPHLSLLYGELPAPQRAHLRTGLEPELLGMITINALQAVDTSHADYGRWSVEASWPLRVGP